jgi:ketosteroid isomerase-like protein
VSVTSSEVAIANLLAEYAERLDAADYAGVAELFRDARLQIDEFGLAMTGPDDIRDFYTQWTQRHDDTGTLRTRHVTTNLILDVDEQSGSATARSYVTVFQAADGFALQPIFCGRYRDSFDRRDGDWRFSARTIITDLVGDLSRHARLPAHG